MWGVAGRFELRMGLRKRVAGTGKGAGLPLMEEIEAGSEKAVRRLLEKGDLGVADLLKIREVAREILAERPRQITVRWVNSCEGTKDIKTKDGNRGTEKNLTDKDQLET